MKPRIGRNIYGNFFKFICRGRRADSVEAIGLGVTIEEAYFDWLSFDENDIPF
jgi:hypothetical protein